MTTFEYATARTQSILTRLVLVLAPRRRALSAALGRMWGKVAPLTLPVMGAGCFVAAAFTVSTLVGLVALGFGFFFVEWRASK